MAGSDGERLLTPAEAAAMLRVDPSMSAAGTVRDSSTESGRPAVTAGSASPMSVP